MSRALYWLSGRPLFALVGRGFAALLATVRRLPGFPRYERGATRLAGAVFARARLPQRIEGALEPFLEAQRCRSIDPVLVVSCWALAALLGAYPSAGGAVATTPLILAFLPLVSGINPFLGLTAGVAFAAADWAAKLLAVIVQSAAALVSLRLPGFVAALLDSSGTIAAGMGAWSILVHAGAVMVGAFAAYSTLALTGVLPGISARVFRFATYNIARTMLPGLGRAAAILFLLAGGGAAVWWMRGTPGLVLLAAMGTLALVGMRFGVADPCGFCGKEFGAHRYCQFCLAPRADGDPASLEQTHCRECGAVMPAMAPWCPSCYQANLGSDGHWIAEHDDNAAHAARIQQQRIRRSFGWSPDGPAANGIGTAEQVAARRRLGWSPDGPPATGTGTGAQAAALLRPIPAAPDPSAAVAEALGTLGAIVGGVAGLGVAYEWMEGPSAALAGGVDRVADAVSGGARAVPVTAGATASGGSIDWNALGDWNDNSGTPGVLWPSSATISGLDGIIDWDARHPGHDLGEQFGREIRVQAWGGLLPLGPGDGERIATMGYLPHRIEGGWGALWAPEHDRPSFVEWHAAPDGACHVPSGLGNDSLAERIGEGWADVAFADGSVERRWVVVDRLLNHGDPGNTLAVQRRGVCQGVDAIREVITGRCDDPCVVATGTGAVAAPTTSPVPDPYPHFSDLLKSPAGPAVAVGAALPPSLGDVLVQQGPPTVPSADGATDPEAAHGRLMQGHGVVSGHYADSALHDRHEQLLYEAYERGDMSPELVARLAAERDDMNAAYRQAELDALHADSRAHADRVNEHFKQQDAAREQERLAAEAARRSQEEALRGLRAAAGKAGLTGNEQGNADVYNRLTRMIEDARAGKSVDADEMARMDRIVRRGIQDQMYGAPKVYDGSAASEAALQAETVREGVRLTGREVFTGVNADGKTSFKSMALRGLLGAATGGGSEMVLETGAGLYTVHDGVMAGKSGMESFKDAAKGVVIGELAGRGIQGLGLAGARAGGVAIDVIGSHPMARSMLHEAENLVEKGMAKAKGLAGKAGDAVGLGSPSRFQQFANAADLEKRIALAQKNGKPEYIHSLYRKGGMEKLAKMEELGQISKAQADYLNKTMGELTENASRRALPGAVTHFEDLTRQLGVPVKVKEIAIGDSGSSARGGARSIKTDADRTIVATFDDKALDDYARLYHGGDKAKAYHDLNQRLTHQYSREVSNELGGLSGFKQEWIGGQPVTRTTGGVQASDVGFDAYSGLGSGSGKADSYGAGFTNARQSVQGRTQIYDPARGVEPGTGDVRLRQGSSDALIDQWEMNRGTAGSGPDPRTITQQELAGNYKQQMNAVEGLDGGLTDKAQLQKASKAVMRADDFGGRMQGPGSGGVLDPEIADLSRQLRNYPQDADRILKNAGLTQREFIERARASVIGHGKSMGID